MKAKNYYVFNFEKHELFAKFASPKEVMQFFNFKRHTFSNYVYQRKIFQFENKKLIIVKGKVFPKYKTYTPIKKNKIKDKIGETHNRWIEQQDRIAEVERLFPSFSSYYGVNQRAKDNYVNYYALNAEDAKKLGLTSVFGGKLFIDQHKHLYILDNDKYYHVNWDCHKPYFNIFL